MKLDRREYDKAAKRMHKDSRPTSLGLLLAFAMTGGLL